MGCWDLGEPCVNRATLEVPQGAGGQEVPGVGLSGCQGSGGKETTPRSRSRKQGTSPLAAGSWRPSCASPSPWGR